ncbi:MAG TPA: zinc-binding dehydrogenase [Chloroflexota bacterium]|nr:zinc-binding dehydrogenase [Chloroflexota bacterium]
MKGVVKFARGDGNVELRDVAEPELQPGHALIKVAACGICGTDLHILHDEYPTNPPVVLGHEMAGTVVAVASDVTGVSSGERVTALTYSYTCGQCRYCQSGRLNLCPQRRSFGSGVNGAMAPWLIVPARNLYRLPANVDDLTGALTEPLACCVRGILDYAAPKPGDVLVVSGPGPIGLFSAMVAKTTGATVIVLGLNADERRLEIARQIGVDHVVNVQQTDVAAFVRDLTGGAGADVVVECAGAEKSAQTCLDLVARGATYVQMGLFGAPVRFDLTQIAMREVRIAGPFGTLPSSWSRTLRLLGEGRLNPRLVLSDVIPLEGWHEGFGKAEAKDAGKVVLTPA